MKRGEGLPERGVPWRCKLSDVEQWWWSRGATESAGKKFEGAPGVGVELGVVSGGLKGDRAVVHDGSTMASMAAIEGGGGKGCSTGTGAPFYCRRRRLANGGVRCGQGRQCGDETGGGRVDVATAGSALARAAPLFGPCG
jgi:hypothetical protein